MLVGIKSVFAVFPLLFMVLLVASLFVNIINAVTEQRSIGRAVGRSFIFPGVAVAIVALIFMVFQVDFVPDIDDEGDSVIFPFVFICELFVFLIINISNAEDKKRSKGLAVGRSFFFSLAATMLLGLICSCLPRYYF